MAKASRQPGGRGAATGRDRPERKAGGADALEIEVAREVVGARVQRVGRRIEPRLHGDEGADRGRLALAHGEPDALRPAGEARRLDRGDAEHDAVAALALLARLDVTGHGDAVGGRAQHGVLDEARLDGGDGKPRRQRGAADGHRKRGARPHEDGECHGGDARAPPRPTTPAPARR